MRQRHWTSPGLLFIVLAFHLFLRPIGAQDGTDPRLQEAELQIQAQTEQILKLQATLVRREKELEKLRADHARAILDHQRLRDELAALRVKSATYLVNADDTSAARSLAQILQDLQKLAGIHRDLLVEVADYQRRVDAALDLAGVPLDAEMRTVLRTKCDEILRILRDAGTLATPEPKATAPQLAEACRVMAVNEELGVLVLDAGRDQGAYPGTVWQVASHGQTITVQVIESRPTLSAAIVTAGALSLVTPGAEARRETRAEER